VAPDHLSIFSCHFSNSLQTFKGNRRGGYYHRRKIRFLCLSSASFSYVAINTQKRLKRGLHFSYITCLPFLIRIKRNSCNVERTHKDLRVFKRICFVFN
jgi:hypothetical protein